MDGGGCRQRIPDAGMSGALRCHLNAASLATLKQSEAVA